MVTGCDCGLNCLLDDGVIGKWWDWFVCLVVEVKIDFDVGEAFAGLDSNGVGLHWCDVNCFDDARGTGDVVGAGFLENCWC